jgi:3-dehydroquinate dehydratase II
MKILVINGPNINMLGLREPAVYGSRTFADLLEFLKAAARENGIELELFQSNSEGAIVDIIQWAYGKVDGIVINPAAYTHTSVALLDALKAVSIPSVEVHLSDPGAREDFRHVSYVRAACVKTIAGKGFEGYREALQFLKDYLNKI